jgi:hypothetical protein
MSEDFERKLIELMNEAKERRLLAIYVVLHMLVGCYRNDTQSKFAKWCCQFSPLGKLSVAGPEINDDFPEEWDLGHQ